MMGKNKTQDRGATALTYGLVVGLVGIAALAAVTRIGDSIDILFGTTSSTLTSAIDNDGGQEDTQPRPTDNLFEFTSHTFTSCGVGAGPTPPTQAQCRSAYNTTWDDDGANFSVSPDGFQRFTIPRTGSYRFTVDGASGGAFQSGSIAQGGRVVATASFTAGEEIILVVGQQGQASQSNFPSGFSYYPTGGFNGGGGTGYPTNNCSNCGHASGGGASDVRVGGTGLNDRVLVAGGGAGSAAEGGDPSSTQHLGGRGGGLTGETGRHNGCSLQVGGTGGAGPGGGQSAGGQAPDCSGDQDGESGSFGAGGRGQRNDGGGGGGGWYGGAGGGNNSGGGGGSNYADSGIFSSVTHTRGGASAGNGQIRVEFVSGP